MKDYLKRTILIIAGVGVALTTVITAHMINVQKGYPIILEETSITSDEMKEILRNRDFRSRK